MTGAVSLPEPAADDWGFPRAVAGINALVSFGRARGVGADRLLSGTGLVPAELAESGQEVIAAQEMRVVRNLRAVLGEVGLSVGETYRPATFGAFGYAMLASHTVLEAMQTALRFIDLSFAFAIPRAELLADEVVVSLDATTLPPDVRRFLLERDASAVRTVLDGLVPGGVGARLQMQQDRAEIRFDAVELKRPLAERSADTLALAEAMCRDVVGRRRARDGFAQDVRVLITQRLPRGAAMAEVASALGYTERTLRRRLQVEGVGYQVLLDEVRSSMAAALTSGLATMPVAELAARLGYGSAPA
ncbi:MAG: AraC family transcriptional regulator ligand-binding domain-containing protein, partial [Nocardioides sp.]